LFPWDLTRGFTISTHAAGWYHTFTTHGLQGRDFTRFFQNFLRGRKKIGLKLESFYLTKAVAKGNNRRGNPKKRPEGFLKEARLAL